MRGSPLLHLLAGMVAFALFAVPLARLTSARPRPVPSAGPAQPDAAAARRVLIRVRLAHAPVSLSLKRGGTELIPRDAPRNGRLLETEASLALPSDGLELALAARWPDGTPDTAVTVELEPDELEARRETRWSAGPALSEILEFRW